MQVVRGGRSLVEDTEVQASSSTVMGIEGSQIKTLLGAVGAVGSKVSHDIPSSVLSESFSHSVTSMNSMSGCVEKLTALGLGLGIAPVTNSSRVTGVRSPVTSICITSKEGDPPSGK